MAVSRWVTVLWLATAVVACGSSDSSSEGGKGGDGASGGSGAGGPGAGGPGAGGTGAGGAGGSAGACAGVVCDEGEAYRCFDFCDGTTDCAVGNVTCSEHDFGICGCNGVAYETLCDLDAAGFVQGGPGSCEPPAGYFGCEQLLCRTADQWCATDGTSAYCYPNEGCTSCSCLDLPTVCPAGNGSCEDVSGGGVIVTCPG